MKVIQFLSKTMNSHLLSLPRPKICLELWIPKKKDLIHQLVSGSKMPNKAPWVEEEEMGPQLQTDPVGL